MADISKIKTLDGTTYDIKDATARDAISNITVIDLPIIRGTGDNAIIESGINVTGSDVFEPNDVDVYTNIASGNYSHAEGVGTTSSGHLSHAEGSKTTAHGFASHAEGYATDAFKQSQHVFGEYNIADYIEGSDTWNSSTRTGTVLGNERGNYIEIVGNGTSENARSNARTLDWDGNEVLAGTLTTGGNIYSGGRVRMLSDNIDYEAEAPESDVYSHGVYTLDASDNEIGFMRSSWRTDGTISLDFGIQLFESNKHAWHYNGFSVNIGSDGTNSYDIYSPAAFRKALELGNSSGGFPITIGQGGTGLTSSPSMLTNLGSTSAANVLAASPRPGVTGTLGVGNGGTGLTSSPSMLTNLGSTSAANVLAASPRPGVTGTLGVGNGGTGLTSSPSMLTNLGSTTAANVLAASPRPGVTGTLAVAHGGTGATTYTAALNNLHGAHVISMGSVTSSTSHSITFSGAARCILAVIGTAAARQGLYIIYGINTTSLVVSTVQAASALTVATSNSKVTITSSTTSNASCYLLVLDGRDNVTTA